MNITSITYKNINLGNTTPTDFLLGNVGDAILCTVLFTSTVNTFTSANLIFNLIQNSDNTTAANPNRTKNLQTQNEQNYQGNITQVNASINPLTLKVPKQASTIVAPTLTVINTVAKTYQIQFIFFIAPYILPTNASGDVLTIPNWFNNAESLKPYLAITCYPNALDTTVLDSGSNYDNATLNAKLGNVGYFNERFNGLAAPYELVSFVYSNSLVNLDPQQNCIGTAKVKSNTSAFSAINTKVQLFIFELKEKADFISSQTFNENQIADNTSVFSINTVVNSISGILTNCKAVINGSNIDISFTIPANKINSQFCIYAKVFEDITIVSNPNYCNVLLKLDTPEVALFNPISIVNYTGTGYPISFRYHTEVTIDNSPNHVKGFKGDWYQALFRVREQNNAEVQNISISVVRMSGEVLDIGYIINTTTLPFAIEQPYNLVSGDWRQEVSIIKVGSFYECKFAFIIREDWVAYNDIVLRVVVNGTQNGLTFGGDDYTFNSPEFILYDYELPINLPADAQAIGFTSPESSKQFYLASNPLIKADFIFAGLDTLVQFKFRASNTNDLEAILSDLVAYFTLNFDNGIEETKQSIHSIWGVSDNCPFTQPAGGIAVFPKIEILDIETAMTSVNAIWAKIVELGYSNAKMKITGRLDKKLPPLYIQRYLLHARGNNASDNFRPFISFTSQFSDFVIIDVLSATTNINYKYSEDLAPNWDAITPVPKATVLNQIAIGSGVFKLQICPDINASYSECTMIFAITKEGIAPANTWSYNFNDTISDDTVIGFDDRIQINSAIGVSANTYFGIRLSPNIAFGNPLAFNIATINAVILSLPIGTAFEIQLIDFSRANITLTYNYL